jgi:chlorite dismutase
MSGDTTSPSTAVRGVVLQALALGLDAAWRRLPDSERAADARAFAAALAAGPDDGVTTVPHSSIGLEPGVDLLLWSAGPDVDAIERFAARLLRSGLGRWLTVRHALLGQIAPSQYVAKPSSQEVSLLVEEPSRYLVVYPFTKATEWYLLAREARQGVMNEHMRIGREYPTVRQALGYSFGLDDGDFLVAYGTDDLEVFGDLVRALRGTESRRSTVRDTPILLGVCRDIEEILELLGAPSGTRT